MLLESLQNHSLPLFLEKVGGVGGGPYHLLYNSPGWQSPSPDAHVQTTTLQTHGDAFRQAHSGKQRLDE